MAILKNLDRSTALPALAAVALAAALAATACGGDAGPDGTPTVPVGDWRGDVGFPGGPDAVWGATWHVARADTTGGRAGTGTGLRLSLSLPTQGGMGPVPLEVAGDKLRFPLPYRRAAACAATRGDDGTWRGSCDLPDGGEVALTMAPPGREPPVGAARMALERVEGDWRTTTAGRIRIHARPGTEAGRHREAVARHARAALAEAERFLGTEAADGPVDLVYLENPEEMERATGHAVRGGWADAGANAVLLVTYEGGSTGVLHELIHVVSIGRWGTAARPGMWLQEGVAEWGAGARCGEVHHGRLDRYLHRRGDGLSLDELTSGFRRRDDVITMPQATTLAGYLLDAHGPEAVRGLWDRGIGRAGAVLGYGAAELERRWRAWVEERWEPATEAEFEATIGSDTGCPREAPPPPGAGEGDAPGG